MSPVLELELGTEPIERAEVDLAIAGFFADERPLRGAAGRVDWRLCGLISQQLEAGSLRGEPGEAVLLACFGRLGAPHVLALGLGERAHFGRDDVRSHTREAVARAVRLGVRRVALAPLGLSAAEGPSSRAGRSGDGDSSHLSPASELPELLDDVVSAALDALQGAAASLRLRLLIEADEAPRAGRVLAEAIAGVPEVAFQGASTEPSSVPSGR